MIDRNTPCPKKKKKKKPKYVLAYRQITQLLRGYISTRKVVAVLCIVKFILKIKLEKKKPKPNNSWAKFCPYLGSSNNIQWKKLRVLQAQRTFIESEYFFLTLSVCNIPDCSESTTLSVLLNEIVFLFPVLVFLLCLFHWPKISVK